MPSYQPGHSAKPYILVIAVALALAGSSISPDARFYASRELETSAPPSNMPVEWDHDVIPSLLTNQLAKNYTNARVGDDFWIPTESIVLDANFTIRNIRIEPIIYNVEDFVMGAKNASGLFETLYFQQLKVPASCHVPWISLFTQYMNVGAVAPDWSISIWNASADAYQLPYPSVEIAGSGTTFNPAYEIAPVNDVRYNMAHWENVSMPAVVLDTNKTYAYHGFYHFFVVIKMPTYLFNTGNQFWFYNNDTLKGSEDGGRAFAQPWDLFSRERVELQGIDFTLITKLVPVSPAVRPEAIDLRVNGERVTGAGGNNGFYRSDEQFRAADGRVHYAVTSAWSNLPGGVTRFDLTITYIHGTHLHPQLRVTIPEGEGVACWNATFDVDYQQLPSFPVATLYVNIPLSWTNLTFWNSTKIPSQGMGFSTNMGPTGKYRAFSAAGLTPGDYTLLCKSPLVPSIVQLALDGGSIGLDDVLHYNSSIPGGWNGRIATLQSDYEGFISGFDATSGTADGDILARIQMADGKGIKFSNTLLPDLAYVLSIFTRDLATNIGHVNISADFSLGINPTEGFLATNIEDIDLVLDYAAFNDSLGIANLTAMNVPDNPAWNLDGLAPKDLFWRALLNDTSYVRVNLTYDPSGDHFSDMHYNFTCRGIEAGAEIHPSRLKEIAFYFSMNFSTSTIANQEVYMRNQSSGAFVQLQGVRVLQMGNQRPYIHWNSSEALGPANLTQFVKPGLNVVEVVVRSFNATNVDPGSNQLVGVNMALSNFKYTNTFKNFTIQLFNWSSGTFSSTSAVVTPGMGASSITLPLNATFSPLFHYYNATSNEVRVRLTGNALVPILNTASVTLDRIMAAVKYDGFNRYWWDHAIVDARGFQTFAVQNQTLFDAPNNNFSSSVDVNAFIDYEIDYQFCFFWNNGTDIAIANSAIHVNKTPVSVRVGEGFLESTILENGFATIDATLAYVVNGTGIPGKTVSFKLSIATRDGHFQELDVSGTTDASGVSSITVQTSASWRSFYVEVRYETDDVRLSPATSDPTRPADVLTVSEYAVRIIINNAATIFVIAGTIIALAIVKRGQDKKRRHGWAIDAGRLRDARKIRHVLVISKESGACIFDRGYSQQNLDADLVSGFLTAIASFSKEIGPRGNKPDDNDEAIYFDYQNFKILISNGNFVRGAIILDGEPTENLKANLVRFVDAFEGRYDMAGWRGNVAMFSTAEELVEGAFETSLLKPLVVNDDLRQAAEKNIPTSVGKALFQVATSVSADQGYFVVSTLAIYAPANKKMTRDQVLAEIYRLKKRGFIVPYKPLPAAANP